MQPSLRETASRLSYANAIHREEIRTLHKAIAKSRKIRRNIERMLKRSYQNHPNATVGGFGC